MSYRIIFNKYKICILLKTLFRFGLGICLFDVIALSTFFNFKFVIDFIVFVTKYLKFFLLVPPYDLQISTKRATMEIREITFLFFVSSLVLVGKP